MIACPQSNPTDPAVANSLQSLAIPGRHVSVFDRRLEHVIAVAREGAFTKAAQRIGITQSGLTKSIADIEREIGYSLFYRTARGVLTTEQGREFVERATRLLDDARILLQGDGNKDPYAKALRIGACPASLEWLLARPLAALLGRHPTIILDVVGSNFERGVQLLRNGSVDISIGFDAAFAEWSDLKRSPIAAMHPVPFVRKGHPILERRPAHESHLTHYDLVAPSDSRPYTSMLHGLYESEDVPWQRHVHTIDHFSIVKRIIATTDAIGIATEDYAHSREFAAAFVVAPGPNPFPALPLCCAMRSRWEPSAAVKAFLQVMEIHYPAQGRSEGLLRNIRSANP